MNFEMVLIKSGDIILFHNKSFSLFSSGIRILTGSYWNHCGMIVEENKEFFIIEALGKVEKTPLTKYLEDRTTDVKIIRLKEEAFATQAEYLLGLNIAIARMYKAIGSKYDVFAILYLGIRYGLQIIGKLVPKTWNPFQQRSKFFCSELVCSSCYRISSKYEFLFQGKTKQNCGTTTPKDISKSNNVYFITGKDKL
jgi:hypothetical protein